MKRLSLAVIAMTFFAACSGPAEEPAEATESQGEEQTEAVEQEVEAVEEAPKAVTLNLSTTGETMTEMAYEPNRLTAPAGAEVTIILENKATAAAMIHNAVIIEAGKQSEVAEDGLAAGPDNAYVGESEFIIAATPLANPGETVEVTFTAPSEPGTYQFICTYPGHTAMKGILMIK
jgi:azurin